MHDYGPIYRHMSEAYGFTPDQISNMTYAQIGAYTYKEETFTANQIQGMMG